MTTVSESWLGIATDAMKLDIQVRIRRRIRARLDQLDMTAREFARAIGHDDAWASGVLKGTHGIHWKDFDAICRKLRLEPSELVRLDDSELRELTPSEMRLLNHYRATPDIIRRHLLEILDYFAAQPMDPEVASFLDRFRSLPRSLRRPTLAWLIHLLEEGIPPERLVGAAARETDEASDAPAPPRRSPRSGT